MGSLPNVLSFQFYEMDVWLLGGPYEIGDARVMPLSNRSVYAFEFPITGVTTSSVAFTFAAAKPVTIVGYLVAADGRANRIFLGDSVPPGPVNFSFVNDSNGEKFSFEFSDPVTATELTIRDIRLRPAPYFERGK
jgi:hypothetical protein